MSDNFPLNFFFSPNEHNSNKNKDLSVINKTLNTDKTDNFEESNAFSDAEIEDINNEILTLLKRDIIPQKYSAYFENTFKILKINNELIVFGVTTPFIKKMIEMHNISNIKKVLFEIFCKEYDVEIQVIGEQPNISNTLKNENIEFDNYEIKRGNTVSETKFKLNELQPLKEDLESSIQAKFINHLNDRNYGQKIDPKKSFDNFVVGPNNNFAHASAIAVSNKPGKVYPSLYIHGNSGLGKTHLLHAVANFIQTNHPTLKICITTAKDFMAEMVEAIQKQAILEFRKKYSENIDVLMIDDIHELKNKSSTQNEFFHVFNELYNKGKQLIFTSDKHPKDIDGIEDRIRTRLAWGMVVDIQLPDLETRIAILKRKAKEEDIYIPDDVINLIAKSIKNNIRELEGSLIKLGAFSSVFNVDIDLEIAKEQLKLNENSTKDKNSIEDILKIVASYYKITQADLLSKSRNKEITHARHIAMYLANKILKSTLVSIGQFFDRDHSSVIHAIDKINRSIKENTLIKQEIYEIESKL